MADIGLVLLLLFACGLLWWWLGRFWGTVLEPFRGFVLLSPSRLQFLGFGGVFFICVSKDDVCGGNIFK